MRRLLAALCFSSVLVLGQSERGNITGIVTDSSGAPLASAPVTLMNTDTNTISHVQTTGTGEYNVPNLTPGVYRVEVVAPGFKTFVVDKLTLTAGATLRADAQLEVGQVNESVEVSAQAIQMQTDDAKISNAVQISWSMSFLLWSEARSEAPSIWSQRFPRRREAVVRSR